MDDDELSPREFMRDLLRFPQPPNEVGSAQPPRPAFKVQAAPMPDGVAWAIVPARKPGETNAAWRSRFVIGR